MHHYTCLGLSASSALQRHAQRPECPPARRPSSFSHVPAHLLLQPSTVPIHSPWVTTCSLSACQPALLFLLLDLISPYSHSQLLFICPCLRLSLDGSHRRGAALTLCLSHGAHFFLLYFIPSNEFLPKSLPFFFRVTVSGRFCDSHDRLPMNGSYHSLYGFGCEPNLSWLSPPSRPQSLCYLNYSTISIFSS